MAFLQPAAPRQPFFRVPAVVLWLLFVLAALHLARVFSPAEQQVAWIGDYAFIPARYVAAYGGSWWDRAIPFLSYMGLHNDFTHLGINCLWLLAFAPIVARRFGPLLFLLFFTICGVAAAATHLALNWGSMEPVIGASGAISGLMAAGLRLMPTMGAGPDAEKLMPIFSRQFMLFTLVWAGVNVVFGVTGVGLGGENGLIAWQAHLGGYVAGMLLAGPFDSLRPLSVGAPLE